MAINKLWNDHIYVKLDLSTVLSYYPLNVSIISLYEFYAYCKYFSLPYTRPEKQGPTCLQLQVIHPFFWASLAAQW